MEQRYGTEVWNRGMERILQGGMERGYETGVWNGCGPGACSGPPILTCPHICIYIYVYIYMYISISLNMLVISIFFLAFLWNSPVCWYAFHPFQNPSLSE